MSEQRDGMPRLLVLACGALASEILHASSASTLQPHDPDVPARPPSQHARPHRSRTRGPAGAGGLPLRERPDRLRRLRNRGPARFAGGPLGERRAPSRGPLLRVLRHLAPVHGTPRGGTRNLLPDRLPRPGTSTAWSGSRWGLSRHPQLRDMYFGNYRKLVYLSQFDDPELVRDGQGGGAIAWASSSITIRSDWEICARAWRASRRQRVDPLMQSERPSTGGFITDHDWAAYHRA